jgi:phosphohistidine phosphatase SixA
VRVEVMHKALGSLLLAVAAVLFSPQVRAQQIAAETPQTMLAAQIRTQGFACEKPLGAVSDKRRSRPDRAVWVLNCSNAIYRITRAPDMAAKVEPLP